MPELLEPADARGGNREVENVPRDSWPVIRDEPRDAPGTTPVTVPDPRGTIHEPRATTHAPVLLFEQVSKWYGPVIGVNQVTLELRPGITGLVGANGSGKSTLLRLAAGQLRPDLGRVEVSGHDAWTATAKQHLGYCPELDVFYEEMSGRRFLETMARLCGIPRRQARHRTGEVLELVGMSGRAEKCVRGYSKGMRQRIKLAQALLHDPALLLLDEPLSGIDPIGRRESLELFLKLAQWGKCLLISSHELEELEKLTDHVAIMARGRIAAVGTLPEIRDLLDHHPLTIRIRCDASRKLSAALVHFEDVVGVEVNGDDTVHVRAKNPRRFFGQLKNLVLEENYDIRHLETLDDSTHAILDYLLRRPR